LWDQYLKTQLSMYLQLVKLAVPREHLSAMLEERAKSVYHKFGRAIAQYDPQGTGVVSQRDFIECIRKQEWAYWGADEQEEIIRRLSDPHGMVHYAAFMHALQQDTYMTQPISAFLKPKQMRNTSDIFNAEQGRRSVEYKGKRSIGPEIQPPLDRTGWEDVENSATGTLSTKDVITLTNPLVMPSQLGRSRRFVFGPLPSDVEPDFAYGIQNGPSDNITDVVSNAFGRQAVVHAKLRNAIWTDKRMKSIRPAGGHTRSSLLRASAIHTRIYADKARRWRDASASVNGIGPAALEQAELGF